MPIGSVRSFSELGRLTTPTQQYLRFIYESTAYVSLHRLAIERYSCTGCALLPWIRGRCESASRKQVSDLIWDRSECLAANHRSRSESSRLEISRRNLFVRKSEARIFGTTVSPSARSVVLALERLAIFIARLTTIHSESMSLRSDRI